MEIDEMDTYSSIFETVTDCELLRYANMEVVTLVEHPIGGKLLDKFLLSEDQSGQSLEQIMIKRYRVGLKIKADISKLQSPKYMLEFINICPTARWAQRILQNKHKDANVLQDLMDRFCEASEYELKYESFVMPFFRQSVYAEIRRRNAEAFNKRKERQRAERQLSIFTRISNYIRKKIFGD